VTASPSRSFTVVALAESVSVTYGEPGVTAADFKLGGRSTMMSGAEAVHPTVLPTASVAMALATTWSP